MIELNDFNISQLEFKNLPSDKKLKYIMHGNIYQFESDFYINGIFMDNDKNYYLSLLPLKGLSAFPLGTIFEEMKVTNENILKNILDAKITLNMKLTGFSKIENIPVLKEKFSRIPDEISGYSGQTKTVLNQLVAVYKDKISRKTLYIPHYEIARWYYIKSSSMCRQVLSANLEGLYYEANYLDKNKKEAELIMKHGSSNGDAADIFRFAKDEFANIMFHNFSLDLAANKSKYAENKKYQTTKIRANFPVYGDLNLKIKGFNVNKDSIFVYQFTEEDSRYPFDELNVYRYGPNEKKEKKAIINKKSPNKSEMVNKIDVGTPSSEYHNQTTTNNVVSDELRNGLKDKKINFKPMLIPSEENESVGEHTIQVSGLDLELSLHDASKSGDENIVHTSLVSKIIDEDDKFKERENNLVLFNKMIFILKDLDNKEGEGGIGIGVSILQHANLPRKPKNDESRSTWKKAFLADETTPRQYMIAHIAVKNKNFYAIEIEKSNEDEKIAVWIVHKQGEVIHSSILHKIIRHYTKSNGKWEFEKLDSSLDSFHINHVGTEADMAERLYKKLKEMN